MAKSEEAKNAKAEAASEFSILGPGSLTWKYFGDKRSTFLIFWAATLQNMHPTIGAALVQHSDVFDNEMSRLLRSAAPISGTVYDVTGETAQKVRSFHKDISGNRPDGESYHALNPDAYYWAHATFFYMQIVAAEYFGKPFTRAEKEQLFEESKEWYRRYGVSERPMPETFADFEAYWEDIVERVLVVNDSTKRVPVMNGLANPRPFQFLDRRKWAKTEATRLQFYAWVARGTLPKSVREKNGWRWTAADAVALRLVGLGIRLYFAKLPAEERLEHTARKAFKAVGVTP